MSLGANAKRQCSSYCPLKYPFLIGDRNQKKENKLVQDQTGPLGAV